MLPLLKDLISRNPFVEEVDFSDKEIYTLDSHMVELLGRFTELKKVIKKTHILLTLFLDQSFRQLD